MPPDLRTLLIALLLAGAVWQPAGTRAEDGCEEAKPITNAPCSRPTLGRR